MKKILTTKNTKKKKEKDEENFNHRGHRGHRGHREKKYRIIRVCAGIGGGIRLRRKPPVVFISSSVPSVVSLIFLMRLSRAEKKAA